MGRTYSFTDDEKHEPLLPVLGQPAGSVLENILNAADQGFNYACRLYQNPMLADEKVYITASMIQTPNGSGRAVAPQGLVTPVTPLTTINFQTQAITGATVDITFPASVVGRFRRAAFTLRADSVIEVVFSGEFVSLGSLPDPGGLFVAGMPIGWIDLECTHVSGLFKTAGSSSDVIENAVGGVPRIINVQSGGGGSSGGAQPGISDEEPIPFDGITEEIEITLPFTMPSINYVPQVQLVALGIANPMFLRPQVTEKTTTTFKVKIEAPVDASGYAISYLIPVLQLQTGTKNVPQGVDELEIDLPFDLIGPLYSVIAEFQNLTDTSPQFQSVVVIDRTFEKFKVKWNAITDGPDYKMAFRVAEFT